MQTSLSETSVGHSLPDILGPGLSVIFCGINPGLLAAASGHHFAGRNNRFWRVLYLSGFIPHPMGPEDGQTLLQYGYGLTTVVARPTRRADQLARKEIEAVAAAFEQKIAQASPRYIAFLGKQAISVLVGRRDLCWGLHPDCIGGARTWILPNPSGLNRSFSLNALTEAYRDLVNAARCS